ncbi:hypothetical protein EQP59_01825 [Ornithobacterium rhinotracheale]|uniref:Vitellogenin II n=1 Tax=Ornithobacterium rhinotracheale TaxID=28251 RepID=A0A3R6ATC9_ORNRH|nr:hypothetical protein [Ornithobacterium rhinotracheale]QAR30183.1 hypothetical protein EQP59_01825 [Ornithobacterium rhinotracheale]
MKSKNKILNSTFLRIIPLGLLFAGVSSCTISQPMARETDGIYYDPSVDVREVAVYDSNSDDDVYYDARYYNPKSSKDDLVRIGGKYFDENGNAPISDYRTDWQRKDRKPHSKYSTWGDLDKDVNVSINYFGSPYYSGFGMGYNWYSPRFYGVYYPYGYYNNFWGWDYPFYGGYGYYSPYYGYNSWSPYAPYYGYYGYNNPYYYGGRYYGGGYYAPYYVKPVPKKERGADSIFRGSSNRISNYQTNNNNYNNRSNNSNVFRSESRSIRNNNNRKTYNNSNWNNSYNSNTYPNYNNTYRSTPSVSSPRNNTYNGSSSGFRKGAFR